MPPTVAPESYLYDASLAPSLVPTTAPARFNATGPAITLGLPPSSSRSSSRARLPGNTPDSDGSPHQPAELPALSLRHEGPFAIPEGMDEWVRENFDNQSPTEANVRQLTPPQDPGVFFNELYEQMAAHPEYQDEIRAFKYSALQSPVVPAAPPPTPAMITAPALVGFPTPGSSIAFTNATSQIVTHPGLHSFDEVFTWATNISDDDPQSEAAHPLCTQADCPLLNHHHYEGTYMQDNMPAPNRLGTLGESNPPPNVWQAIHKGCQWIGTQEDAELISRFIENHGVGGNFLLAPHTNFLWGEEANTPYAVPGAPIIRLPYPAIPSRIHFNAAPNLSAVPNPPIAYTHGINQANFRRCTDPTCPVMHEHGQGIYLHNNEPPSIWSAAFGWSNPPDNIWEGFDRINHANSYSIRPSNSDRWIVANYQKLHVNGVL